MNTIDNTSLTVARQWPGVSYQQSDTGTRELIREQWRVLVDTDPDCTEAHYKSVQFFDHLVQSGAHQLDVLVAADGNNITSLSPILYCNYPFRFAAAGRSVLTVNLRAIQLLGSIPLGTPAGYSTIFSQLFTRYNKDVSTIVLASVKIGGDLWNYIHSAGLVRDSALIHIVRTEYCNTLCLPSTTEEYLTRLSKDQRRHVRRAVKRLAEVGELRLQLINSRDQVAELRAAMIALGCEQCTLADCSRLPGHGGVRWSTDAELASLADHDLLHCYVLYCADKPIAGILGMYYNNRCYMESTHRVEIDRGIGTKVSPGLVIMHLAVADLIERGTVRIEFGYGAPSRDYSNIHTVQPYATVLLLRKTITNRLLRRCYSVFRSGVKLKHKYFPRAIDINQVPNY